MIPSPHAVPAPAVLAPAHSVGGQRRCLTSAALTLAAFGLVALAWTWPLAAHLSTRLPHDAGDPVLNTWILWWNAHALPFTAAWWSPPVMYPVPGALALSEHLAGLTWLSSPVQWLGGSPILAYNVCLLAAVALSGWFTFLLVARLSGSALAGACAGLAFAVTPYRAGQLGHLQVQTTEWIPALLLGLHAYRETGRRRWLVLVAAAWVLDGWSNGYFLLFVPVLAGAWLLWFVDWRRTPRRGVHLVATLAVASLAIAPALAGYRSVLGRFGLSRTAGETREFSATAASFTHSAPLLSLRRSSDVHTQEDYLYPGLASLALVLAGVTMAIRRPGGRQRADAGSTLLFYAAATVLLWACALGPGDPVDPAGGLRPYRWLMLLPGYDGLRAPARFAMLATACLSTAAGLGLARLLERRGPRLQAAAALAAAVWIWSDGMLAGMPLITPPQRVRLTAGRDTPVLEIPPDDARVSVAAMYRSIFHGRPLVNLYSGYTPPHYAILSLALRRGDTSPLLFLARGHGLTVIIAHDDRATGEFEPLVAAVPGARREESTGAGLIYEIPAQAWPASTADGTALPAMLREELGERLVVDLGGRHFVRGLTFPLRGRYRTLPERLLIERSDDGVTWTEAWRNWTGAAALDAAIEEPRVQPVRLALGEVPTRYLRVYPAPEWLRDELVVTGIE